jgi:tRNA (uracil-5-)-methyltransferase TRM9
MDSHIVEQLLEINRRFYSQFGPAFATTRRRIQGGVRGVLAVLPDEGSWLDLGCGSGALGEEWLRRERTSAYLGLDSSTELLQEAQASAGSGRVRYLRADLSDAAWAQPHAEGSFRGALAFAVLHHLPSHALRVQILRQVHGLLEPNGLFIHSEWQFQNSPKLTARIQPWSAAGVDEADLEDGDTLLDWRYALPGHPERVGLRYVHRFTTEELAELALQSGFSVQRSFEADGHGGRLSLYQLWGKDPHPRPPKGSHGEKVEKEI